MSTSTWTGAINNDWDDADNWSPADVPGVNSDVEITSGSPVVSTSIETVNSITDSSDLSFESAGTNTVTTVLDDTGHLRVDHGAGEGGTTLNIGGTLTNSNHLVIGNTTLSASDEVTAAALDNTGRIYLTGSSANQALLDVSGDAGFGTAGDLSGYARLAGDSAIEFESGEITSLAAGSHLGLVGNDAFVEDSTALGSNSALTGLASIGAGALFALHDGAAVSTTGALANDGYVDLDPGRGNGGSSLTVGGALTNSGDLTIGNTALSASDKAAASSLDNTGSINLTGSGANQALLTVSGSAGFGTAGVLSGDVQLAGDSAIEFASGQITTIDGTLNLSGISAFIEDSTALGSNSALTGLSEVAGSLSLDDGASVSTNGSLVSDGAIDLDTNGGGGSRLTVAGTLTIDYRLQVGNFNLTRSDAVTAAAVDNNGTLVLGGGAGANHSLLDVASAAGFGTAGTLTGFVSLFQNSAIEFLNGEISTIDATLNILSNTAFVEDSTALGSNSALTGLSDVSGTLNLDNGAAVSTTGPLANSGVITVDPDDSGSSLSIAGGLTNGGTLDIGNNFLSSSDSVTANSFVNSGTVDLTGHGTAFAALDVSGATTNNGSISIATDTEELAGAVGGTGSFSLSGANLQFDSSVSAGQTISETGMNESLTLNEAQSFAATISGFGTGDTIDATNFLLSGTTYNFVENSAMTSGTLTLSDTSLSLTANIQINGVYTKSDFTLAPDSGAGTLVKFV
jgi:hypothetical protein